MGLRIFSDNIPNIRISKSIHYLFKNCVVQTRNNFLRISFIEMFKKEIYKKDMAASIRAAFGCLIAIARTKSNISNTEHKISDEIIKNVNISSKAIWKTTSKEYFTIIGMEISCGEHIQAPRFLLTTRKEDKILNVYIRNGKTLEMSLWPISSRPLMTIWSIEETVSSEEQQIQFWSK